MLEIIQMIALVCTIHTTTDSARNIDEVQRQCQTTIVKCVNGKIMDTKKVIECIGSR